MLVAGVGNIFKGDDGFATAVVQWLQQHEAEHWPDWIRLRDFGIGGLHLAYELLDGYDDVVIIDAMHRPGGTPGALYVVTPDLSANADAQPALDAHDLTPEAVLATVPGLGGTLGNVTVVGCEPASTGDELGLGPIVRARVPEAARLVCELVAEVVAAEEFAPGHRVAHGR